jgi:hypothetical protein
MFDHPGKKIKIAATVFSVAMGLGAFIYSCLIVRIDAGLSVAIMLGGFLVAYVAGLLLYALGTLVENTQDIRASLRRIEKRNREPVKTSSPVVLPDNIKKKDREPVSEEDEDNT